MKTILVVEDDQAIRECLQMMLEGEGFTVITSSTVLGALAWLSETARMPDLVITDYRCLGDGSHLARCVHRANVPVVMMSAIPREAKKALEEKGLHSIPVVAKPFDLCGFIRQVNSMFPSSIQPRMFA